MTTNVVECKDCAYSREANTPNAVFCMLNHQTFPIPVYGCTNGRPGRIVPQTNGDRIRQMTDEELADFLDRWEMGDVDYSKTFCNLCDGQYDCHDDCLMDWLKAPAEEGNNGT